jgi:hypothetical protein
MRSGGDKTIADIVYHCEPFFPSGVMPMSCSFFFGSHDTSEFVLLCVTHLFSTTEEETQDPNYVHSANTSSNGIKRLGRLVTGAVSVLP